MIQRLEEIVNIPKGVLTFNHIATRVGITLVALETAALGLMILCSAKGIEAASTDTRIFATLTYAGAIRGTILINNALGSATWWSAKHSRQTRAFSSVIDITAFGIRSTRIGQAWINCRSWFGC